MQAVKVQGHGEAASLALAEAPAPRPAATEVLVRVRAAGLNRADLRLAGDHLVGADRIPGTEFAGEVLEVGAACEGVAVGDRIMGLGTAAHAEQTCLDYRLAAPIAPDMDWRTAAALPAWFMTAHNALVSEGGLRPGETVLVQGASSGVGIAAVQLARCFGAGRVIGAGRSPEKLARLAALGLDAGIVTQPGWAERVRDAAGGDGADLIIDLVGGGTLAGNLQSAALRGRMIAVGRLGGQSDELDLNLLALKRLRLVGVTFRSRTIDEKAAVARAFAADVLPLVARGQVRPLIDRCFGLSEIAAAHAHAASPAHFGKVILEPGR